MHSALMTLAAVPRDQALQPLVMPTSVAALTFGCILGNGLWCRRAGDEAVPCKLRRPSVDSARPDDCAAMRRQVRSTLSAFGEVMGVNRRGIGRLVSSTKSSGYNVFRYSTKAQRSASDSEPAPYS